MNQHRRQCLHLLIQHLFLDFKIILKVKCVYSSERYIVIALFRLPLRGFRFMPPFHSQATTLMDATELVCFAISLPKSEMNTAQQKIILVVCCTICEIEVQRMDRGSGI